MKKTALLAGVASMGLFAFAPPPLHAQHLDRDRYEHRDRDRHDWEHERVRYESLPHGIKDAIDQARGSAGILDIVRVTHGDQEFYRVTVGTPDHPRTFRITGWGEVLQQEPLPPMRHVAVHWDQMPSQVRQALAAIAQGRAYTHLWEFHRGDYVWYKAELPNGQSVHVDAAGNQIDQPQLLSNINDYADQQVESQWTHYLRDETDGTVTLLNFDTLPGAVKNTIGQMRGMDRVGEVLQVQNGNDVYYRVLIEGPTTARIVRVAPDGSVLTSENATAQGRVPVSFDTLPGPVKSAISQQLQGQPIQRITQVTRGDQTWYVVQVRRGDHLRIMRYDAQGNLIAPDRGFHFGIRGDFQSH